MKLFGLTFKRSKYRYINNGKIKENIYLEHAMIDDA